MNYLIALQYKYHSNEKSKNKINKNNNMNIGLSSTSNLLELDKENNKNDNNNIINDTNDKNSLIFKTEKKTNIGKYNNNIYNFSGNENSNNNNNHNKKCELVVYPKNIDFNRVLDDIKKANGNSLFYSLRKPNKRKYLDLISENRYNDDKENSNNTINNLFNSNLNK